MKSQPEKSSINRLFTADKLMKRLRQIKILIKILT